MDAKFNIKIHQPPDSDTNPWAHDVNSCKNTKGNGASHQVKGIWEGGRTISQS